MSISAYILSYLIKIGVDILSIRIDKQFIICYIVYICGHIVRNERKNIMEDMRIKKDLQETLITLTSSVSIRMVGMLSDLVARTRKNRSELVREAIDDLYEKYQKLEDQPQPAVAQ